jgi:hypothetical protein
MNILDMLSPDGQPETPAEGGAAEAICSRKGCRAPATTQLLWNNHKIHTPQRRKIWLGCDDHAAWLEDYLKGRSLWKETRPLTPEGPA